MILVLTVKINVFPCLLFPLCSGPQTFLDKLFWVCLDGTTEESENFPTPCQPHDGSEVTEYNFAIVSSQWFYSCCTRVHDYAYSIEHVACFRMTLGSDLDSLDARMMLLHASDAP